MSDAELTWEIIQKITSCLLIEDPDDARNTLHNLVELHRSEIEANPRIRIEVMQAMRMIELSADNLAPALEYTVQLLSISDDKHVTAEMLSVNAIDYVRIRLLLGFAPALSLEQLSSWNVLDKLSRSSSYIWFTETLFKHAPELIGHPLLCSLKNP